MAEWNRDKYEDQRGAALRAYWASLRPAWEKSTPRQRESDAWIDAQSIWMLMATLRSSSEAIAASFLADADALGLDFADKERQYRQRLAREIEATTSKQAKRLVKTTAKRLEESLVGTGSGKRRAMRDAMDDLAGEDRAGGTAITDTTGARSSGSGLAGRLSETADAIWRTEGDARVCPVCAPLDGTGSDVWGDKFPEGPPAHPRCRCELESGHRGRPRTRVPDEPPDEPEPTDLPDELRAEADRLIEAGIQDAEQTQRNFALRPKLEVEVIHGKYVPRPHVSSPYSGVYVPKAVKQTKPPTPKILPKPKIKPNKLPPDVKPVEIPKPIQQKPITVKPPAAKKAAIKRALDSTPGKKPTDKGDPLKLVGKRIATPKPNAELVPSKKPPKRKIETKTISIGTNPLPVESVPAKSETIAMGWVSTKKTLQQRFKDKFGFTQKRIWDVRKKSNLTPDEQEAVSTYCSDQYRKINQVARGAPDSKADAEKYAPVIKNLDQAMAKAPKTDRDVIVYRGDSFLTDQIKDVDFSKMKVRMEAGQYISTSTDPGIAQVFGNKAVMELRIPKGTRFMTGNLGESELILGRRSEIVITGKRVEKLRGYGDAEQVTVYTGVVREVKVPKVRAAKAPVPHIEPKKDGL